ncbi:MAG: YeeE/YedE family protein [Flavobacteriales bacterium]|nr:YeeE/YedE family protein [Flavobacteriales bacterium]
MRTFIYFSIGILFGVVLFKSEVASWFRIYEMFQFDSFHMYGVIGSAVFCGALSLFLIKKFQLKSILDGEKIRIAPKQNVWKRYLFGGVLFGLGWALAGACPGPMFTLLGAGFLPVLLILFSALLGTYFYGVIRDKLPH